MGYLRSYSSGIESQQHFQQCVSAGVKYVLASYYQFGDKSPDIIKQRKQQHPEMEFMIDSGAHTFLEGWEKFEKWTRSQFEDYVKRYVDWLQRNRQYITAAVELDIDWTLNAALANRNPDSSIGVAIVEGWQEKYFRPLQKLGLDIVYVWHQPRKLEGWEKMCQRFDYVGLPGEMSKEPDFNKYMTVAKRYSTRCHGFAATKQLDYRDIEWFSIDSITWKTGEMYGTLIDWCPRAQRLTFIDDKSRRIEAKERMDANGFDTAAILADRNYKEVTRFSLWSMRQMEKFYAKKYERRLFYYELRLPHMAYLATLGRDALLRWWNLMRPESLFKQHVGTKLPTIKEALCALSAVQNGDDVYLKLNQGCLTFLKAYFPSLADPLTNDMIVFQRELATYLSPPNPPPLPRFEADLLVPNANQPRAREPMELVASDFSYDPRSSAWWIQLRKQLAA